MYKNIKSIFQYALYLIKEVKDKHKKKKMINSIVLDDRVPSSEYIDKDRFK